MNRIGCIHEAFEAQAERRPDAIAATFKERHLSYRELNERANRLAHHLRARGVGPEVPVAIGLERSLELIVALLAVLKAGGAYVPLDLKHPKDRMAAVLDDAGVRLLLTETRLLGRLPGHPSGLIDIGDGSGSIASGSTDNPHCGVSPDNIAYIIFTSGSTGRPKGVQVEHRSAIHLFEATQPEMQFGPADIWTMCHSCAFDLSVWEMWGCLLNGGRLVIVPAEVARSPMDFAQLLRRERVTVLNQTPSAIRLLIEAELDGASLGLRLIICGGEALPSAAAKRLLKWNVPLWNFYGPTEATVWAAFGRVCEEDCNGPSVPIGRPINGVEIRVLDERGECLPPGKPGELHIGGICVARGYVNRPELTNERFIFIESGKRFYRTGDLACILPDGRIQFLGRTDDQVKINGFRIELGEIEHALCEQLAIHDAVVVVRPDAHSESRLIAYIVPADGLVPNVRDLRSALRKRLPDYMVPTSFVPVTAMPLNANGKIDRGALPALPDAPPATLGVSDDELEQKLIRIWEQCLGIWGIRSSDDFFEIGGDSLAAVRILVEIEKHCGINLSASAWIQAPTVERMADFIRRHAVSASCRLLVPISNGDRARRPTFFVHGSGGTVLSFRDLARHLGAEWPMYAFQADRLKGHAQIHSSVEEIAEGNVREMRLVQPNGPYQLAGASFGGLVAYEMAQQLRRQGEDIALLALFDTLPFPYETRPFLLKIWNNLRLIFTIRGAERRDYLGAKLFDLWIRFARRKESSNPMPESMRLIDEMNRRAEKNYRPVVYPGRAVFFVARLSPWFGASDWAGLITGGLDVHEVPGDHIGILAEPNVAILAGELRRCLEDAQNQCWRAA